MALRRASEIADEIGGIEDDLEAIQSERDAVAMYAEDEGPEPTAEQLEKLERFLHSIATQAAGAVELIKQGR